MINWLKKINRSRNYFFKKHKLQLKLKLICILSPRHNIRIKNSSSDIRHIVLAFIGKGIGDAIVIGGIIDTLKKNNYQISIISDKRTYFLFESHKNIDNLYLYTKNERNELIKKLKESKPFIFIDSHEITHNSIDSFNLIRHSRPAKTIGFNKKYNIYDSIVNFSKPLAHVSTRYIDLLKFLGINMMENYDYSVHIPEKNKNEALSLIKSIKNKNIITFIPYGSVSERFFSREQINSLLEYFSQYDEILHVVIIGEQDKIREIEDHINISKNTYPSFFTAAQLIKESALVISPDTSMVHLSRAFQKRMVCIYPFKILSNGADNAVVWGPNYDLAVQVRLKEKHIKDAEINLIIEYINTEISKIKNTAY